MKTKLLVLILFLFCLNCFAQTPKLLDYKVKTADNAKERTEMLDAFRADLYKEWKLKFEFVVSYFKRSGDYAWFEGTAERKDGKDMTFPEDSYDCCHAEALFQKKDGKWIMLEGDAFSTDVWYWGIGKRHPKASVSIFPKDSAALR
ncbi:MAG: hypothetical protein JST50_03970 [Bacteroidetes bacterium]|jgi:hypothetical protein|nr:hypothetical protein [Bacteroidota bacterium]